MIFAWTKQFFVATGVFAMVVLGQTANLVLKEQKLAETQLEKAPRTVRIPSGNLTHGN